MSSTEEPPYFDDAELLGKSVILLPDGQDPFNLDKLLESTRRVVKLSLDKKIVGGSHGSGFKVPKDVDYTGVHETQTKSLQVETGDELSKELDTNASLSGSYSGVSAEASAKYSYHTSLNKSNYYGVVSLSHVSFLLTLHRSSIVKDNIESSFISSARKLPEWKDSAIPDEDTYSRYREFFETWGTHSKTELEAQIKAEYNGVASVKGEASVKHTEEYKRYINTRKHTALVKGGDPGLNTDLSNSPDDAEKFSAWADSIKDTTANDAISISVIDIGEVLKEAKEVSDQSISKRLKNALGYFNSFQLIKGNGFIRSIHDSQLDFDLSLSGLPGTKVLLEKFETDNPSISLEKKSSTHWKLVSGASPNIEPGQWGFDALISAPPLPVNVKIVKNYSLQFDSKADEKPKSGGPKYGEPTYVEIPDYGLQLNFAQGGGPYVHTKRGQKETKYQVDSFFSPGEYP
ncbi:hypothetical protein BGW36DRAFT_424567 [Talaromyces proteolyticus]|uniref:MACPF domain-containing protein n=1 Tax=Talaromyces proteolyticus TaxID=1131652 RepID=A0AAD4KZA1_9EURO|nr:uncharacterized protein BGW36DRAFT_424567 [Talaromyces proteolyticus]KAH8702287.1 hypothetical protein BGW36DRAFT_424567 [Talaromyces proteolyticus]